MKILCFNIHGGRDLGEDRDLTRIRTVMDEHGVDIGVFQEVETRPSRGGMEGDIAALAGPGRPYHAFSTSLTEGAGWYGNLMVSRHPIIRVFNHNLDTASHLEPRSAIDALVQSAVGKIRIIGTHLSLKPSERWKEANNLLNLIDSIEEKDHSPVFLMGDINEWRGTSRLLRHLNTIMTPVHTGRTFPSRAPVLRLDRLWHDAKNLKDSARALKNAEARRLSDHLPLLIEISGF
jgi:endonuclease/exonuclease/phosphatase family metal-dependent hydrolase